MATPMRSASVTITVRNMAGAFYPGNPYRNVRTQEAGQNAILATGAHFLLLQEATGVGKPFFLPEGWQLAPASALDRGSGSVVAAAAGVDADVTWRPHHPVLDAFGAYLDFGLMRFDGKDVVIASVHAGGWQDNTWAATGNAAPQPGRGCRPFTSDAILDALLDVIEDRPAILAGDWNEAPNYPSENDPSTISWFGRAAAGGLIEAVTTTFGGPVRTNFCRSAKTAYQNDHVFLTADLAARLGAVQVWNEPGAAVSDHAGITFTLKGDPESTNLEALGGLRQTCKH